MATDYVLVTPDIEDQADTAKRLLEAADDPAQVTTDTSGRSVGFRVPVDVARKGGFADAEDSDDDETEVTEPPRHGAGSGKAAWAAFLNDRQVPFPEDADGDDLRAIWDAHQAEKG